MNSGIYIILCLINNKSYVGYTTNLINRQYSHFYHLRKNTHTNEYLQKAWNKYGEENFIFEVLEECQDVGFNLPEREHFWANLLNVHNRKFGYNIKPTDPTNKIIMSEEIRKKISISRTGIKFSKSHIENLSKSKKGTPSKRKGIPFTEEHKLKISKALKGKVGNSKGFKHSEKTKELWSKQRKGVKLSEITKQKISIKLKNKENKIDQYDLDGNFIQTFLNAKLAALFVKGCGSNIISCCKERQKTAYGFKWKYNKTKNS